MSPQFIFCVILFSGGSAMTTAMKKTQTPRTDKRREKKPGAKTRDALPHIPNDETRQAMEDCRAGIGEAVPHDKLKSWILGEA